MMQTRYFKMSEVRTRADEDNHELIVEGYFARYDDVYQVAEGVTESIRRGAFTESMRGDVRALYNHNTDVVLGRTSAGTLELSEDDLGLRGRIHINDKDTQAVDVYQRIARGDVSGCSFGFDIPKGGEEYTSNPDGSGHWTITRVEPLYEVSPCVFPAYEATHIEARARQRDAMRARELTAWREKMKGVLKHGAESADAGKEN